MEETKEKTASNISEAEWEVMRIVWTLGSVRTGEVLKQLQAKKDWSESTIKTLMRRLVNKGLLKTKKDGRYFIYSATVTEMEMMVAVTTEMMDHMCDMHKGQMLLAILKTVTLSKNDIGQLTEELAQKEKTAPETVDCNCLPASGHSC
ncbi:CopY/TcrY family copper transport repressor [Lactobacillus sp. ESL0791]|uniref:CopY/TcrY family copper transport repressor n=1 Tax=Lactobacillus sp. ESL0791 TaxID=2983234 RepID=UPI0023F86458|nr:CopY/TcrY family copper transport repressor [Lactobacillus sp. ESL0791]MDF7638652.1 CopY/TcrY family copper transport repressor [Lactobacillus sp. ESL0791]